MPMLLEVHPLSVQLWNAYVHVPVINVYTLILRNVSYPKFPQRKSGISNEVKMERSSIIVIVV